MYELEIEQLLYYLSSILHVNFNVHLFARSVPQLKSLDRSFGWKTERYVQI